MLRLLLSYLSLLVLPTLVKAIIGGKEVSDPHKYPWIVGIHWAETLRTESFGCGGSIISKDVVLTAAHCVTKLPRIFISMGHSRISSEESTLFRVESVLIHPDYDPYSELSLNDIALLKLNQSLIFNTTIKPIALPSDNLSHISKNFELRPEKKIAENMGPKKRDFDTFVSYHVAGRGQEKTPKGASPITKNLKELELDVAQDDSCFRYFRYLNTDEKELRNSHEICTQSLKPSIEGVCYGDSGSPLMKIDSISGRVEIIGIASKISGISCKHQAFYTRVSKFLPWINQNLNEFDAKNVISLSYNN